MYNVFGPNNLEINVWRTFVLVFLLLEKRPHINKTCMDQMSSSGSVIQGL